MVFHEKYELLALRSGGQEITLPAKEISSGRDVLVHLLSGGDTPDVRELLAAIDKLPPEHRRTVLDQGDHDGIPYVVTEVLPQNLNLREWMAMAKASPAPPASPAKSGVWKVPAAGEAPPAGTPELGEFTRLFQSMKPEEARRPPQSPEETPTLTMAIPTRKEPPPAPKAEPTAAPAPEPGEFTRLFLKQTPAAPAVPKPEPVAAKPAPAEPPAPPAAEPGEFTRLFMKQTPAAPAASMPRPAQPPEPPPPPPPPAGPGEFTRMMQSPLAAQPAAIPQAPPPVPKPVGEFTRMMQQGDRAETPLPPAYSAPPAPEQSLQPPGEFTRMFASEPAPSEALATPPPPEAPLPQGGAATGAFSRQPARAPMPVASGPSEFTRMFGAPSRPAAVPPPAEPKAAVPLPAPRKSNLPLVLILGGLFLLAVILIVIFALAR